MTINSIFFSVEENDIIELEKLYWGLKSQSRSGKFDLDTFRGIVSPPIPKSIVESMLLVSYWFLSILL